MSRFDNRVEKNDDIEEKVVQISRITRVVRGGRRLRFRAIVVVGDKKGRVGLAVDKSSEVVGAIQKASRKARKAMITINLDDSTISHEVTAEHSGAKVFLKPARKGTGIIAGGAVRPILEVVGVRDILSKTQGSSSRLNNAYATTKALSELRPAPRKSHDKNEIDEKKKKGLKKKENTENKKQKAVTKETKKATKTSVGGQE